MNRSRPATGALLSHFRAKGQFSQGIYYCVISDEDRKSFPELGDAYAIAVGQALYWLLAYEAEYDDDVLLAMSGLNQPNLPKVEQ